MVPRLRRILAGCGLLVATLPASAQRYALRVLPASGTDRDAFAAALRQRPTRFRSERAMTRSARALVPDLQKQGFLAVSCDTMYRTGDTLTAVVQLNPRCRWASFSLQTVDSSVLRAAGIRPADWNTRPLSPTEVETLARRLVQGAAQTGRGVPVWRLENPSLMADEGVSGRVRVLPGVR